MRRSTASDRRRNREKARSRVATDELILVQKKPSKLPLGLVKDLVNTYYETGVGLGGLELVVDFVKQNPDVVRKKTRERETLHSARPVQDSDDSDISLGESSSDDFVRDAPGYGNGRSRSGRGPVIVEDRPGPRRESPPPPPPAYATMHRPPPPQPPVVPGVAILHTGPGPGEYEASRPRAAPREREVPVMEHTGRDPGQRRSSDHPRRPSMYRSAPTRPIHVLGRSEARSRPIMMSAPGLRHRQSALHQERQQAQTLRMPSRISASEMVPGLNTTHGYGRPTSGGGHGFYEHEEGHILHNQARPQRMSANIIVSAGTPPPRRIKVFFGFLQEGDFVVRETNPWRYAPHDPTRDDRQLIHKMQFEYERMKRFRGWFSLKSIGFAHCVRWEWVRAKNREQGWLVTAKFGIFDYEDARSISIFRNRTGRPGSKVRKWLGRLDDLVDSAGKDCFITVHLEELPNSTKILVWLVIGVLVSTGAGIIYAKLKDDDWGTGLSLMSYSMTVFGFAIAIIGIGDHVGLSKPGEGLSRGEDWRYDIPTRHLSTGTKLEQLKDEEDDRKKEEEKKELGKMRGDDRRGGGGQGSGSL